MIGFHYDPQTGALSTPVTLGLYRQGFHLQDDGALKSAIARLVGAGSRARLGQEPPLIGAWRVTLEIIPGAPAATLTGLGGCRKFRWPRRRNRLILSKFNKVPVDQIAQNVLDITHRVDALVASPQIADSIAQLDASLRQIRETTSNVGPKIAELVQQLRSTADEIDQTAKTADKTLGGAPTQNGISSTLQEVTNAARSLRELANYLDRHPEALDQGPIRRMIADA